MRAPKNMPSVFIPGNEEPLLIDRSEFRPNPQTVAGERHTNTILYGIMGAAILGGIGYFFNRQSPRVVFGTVGSTLLGAAGGALLGHHVRTGEEGRSQALQNAAESSHFGQQVKNEMQKREGLSFIEGIIFGAFTLR